MVKFPTVKLPTVKLTTISKKKNIPKRIRELVWKNNIGEEWKGKCYVAWCDNVFTVLSSWHVGHNKPESKGGTIDINNLKPICCDCNLGMGNRYTIEEWSTEFNSFNSSENKVIDILKNGIK